MTNSPARSHNASHGHPADELTLPCTRQVSSCRRLCAASRRSRILLVAVESSRPDPGGAVAHPDYELPASCPPLLPGHSAAGRSNACRHVPGKCPADHCRFDRSGAHMAQSDTGAYGFVLAQNNAGRRGTDEQHDRRRRPRGWHLVRLATDAEPRLRSLSRFRDRQSSEVAFEIGYQSLSQFNRSFRSITGESPTEFRRRILKPEALRQSA